MFREEPKVRAPGWLQRSPGTDLLRHGKAALRQPSVLRERNPGILELLYALRRVLEKAFGPDMSLGLDHLLFARMSDIKRGRLQHHVHNLIRPPLLLAGVARQRSEMGTRAAEIKPSSLNDYDSGTSPADTYTREGEQSPVSQIYYLA